MKKLNHNRFAWAQMRISTMLSRISAPERVLGGVGYDGFDIVDPKNNNHSQDYLRPFSINSLNLNAGLRINYFFNPRFFIGIAAKYNGISYGNKKGSNLSAYPVSIDFIVGH